MDTQFAAWERWVLVGAAVLAGLVLLLRLLEILRDRRRRRARIGAARVRATQSMPLHTGAHPPQAGQRWPDASQQMPDAGMYENPHPQLRIQYTDIYGQASEKVIAVERLDLYRQVVIFRGTEREDLRTLPLGRISLAREAASGQRFSMGLWVEQMRRQARSRGEDGGSAAAPS